MNVALHKMHKYKCATHINKLLNGYLSIHKTCVLCIIDIVPPRSHYVLYLDRQAHNVGENESGTENLTRQVLFIFIIPDCLLCYHFTEKMENRICFIMITEECRTSISTHCTDAENGSECCLQSCLMIHDHCAARECAVFYV